MLMRSNSFRLALLAGVLCALSTPSFASETVTAQFMANPPAFGTYDPFVNSVDHLHIFTADYAAQPVGFATYAGAYIPGSAQVTADLGSFAPGNGFFSYTTESYAANTIGAGALLGVTTDVDGNAALFVEVGAMQDSFCDYLALGTNFDDLYAAIVNGDAAAINNFLGTQDYNHVPIDPNGVYLGQFAPGVLYSGAQITPYLVVKQPGGTITQTGDFQTHGNGYLIVQPVAVPEPASIAALGLGGAVLLRRRRRA